MRLGKQTIVWGKTELFRNTDQFNPQDFALASIPDLEESRIALWAARGTWSFYNFGKIEDVRLELAVNFDDFEPADLGRCGEPFTRRAGLQHQLRLLRARLLGRGPRRPGQAAGAVGRRRRGSRPARDSSGATAASASSSPTSTATTTSRTRAASRPTSATSIRTRDARDARAITARARPATSPPVSACRTPMLVDAAGNPMRLVDTDGDGSPDTLVERGDRAVEDGRPGDRPGPARPTCSTTTPPTRPPSRSRNIAVRRRRQQRRSARSAASSRSTARAARAPLVSTMAMGASAIVAGSGDRRRSLRLQQRLPVHAARSERPRPRAPTASTALRARAAPAQRRSERLRHSRSRARRRARA